LGTDEANGITSPARPSLDALTLWAYLGYLAILSIATHLSGQGWLGFLLAPAPMVFLRLDAFRFMLLALSGYLLFFEASNPAANFEYFNNPDLMVLAYMLLYLFNRRGFAVFRLPLSRGLLPLYAFILYGLALSVGPLAEFGPDLYVIRDVKNLLFLCLVPVLCRRDERALDPKPLFLLLLAILVFTAAHAVVVLTDFVATGARVVTWNEVFFADGVLIAPILLGLDLTRATRRILVACLALCLLGLIAAQTRGLWLSVIVSFALYMAMRMRHSRRFGVGALLNRLPLILLLLAAIELILRFSSGKGAADFLMNRLSASQSNELVDPWSSLGYRIHESLVVWEKRTWFGHGSGARLYIFFTQLGMSKFINWWSIHSEYFEILHKYGFAGLGLFLWFLAATLRRAWKVAMSGSRYPSAIGYVAVITLVNHGVVSITSGYLVRENVMLYMVLVVAMVERYRSRLEPAAAGGLASRPAELTPAGAA
jgi:O-antigen ligase